MNLVELEKIADDLILLTRKKTGERFDRNSILGNLKVNEQTLQSALEIAGKWGYELTTDSAGRVAFIDAPDSLTATETGYNLGTNWLGKNLVAYSSAKSTNDLAAEAAQAGAEHGTVITAEEQTKGRGRLGREWYSPPGSAIYVSIILRPDFLPADAPGISIMTAVALADSLTLLLPDQIQLKWPNDIHIRGRKVAGILTELSADQDKINHLVVGVGINVNQLFEDFPRELQPIATSLRRECGHELRRVDVLQSFLRQFESEFDLYLEHRLAKSHDKIRGFSSLIGREITVSSGKKQRTGIVEDIDVEGRLILQTDEGRFPIIAGEVTVVKK